MFRGGDACIADVGVAGLALVAKEAGIVKPGIGAVGILDCALVIEGGIENPTGEAALGDAAGNPGIGRGGDKEAICGLTIAGSEVGMVAFAITGVGVSSTSRFSINSGELNRVSSSSKLQDTPGTDSQKKATFLNALACKSLTILQRLHFSQQSQLTVGISTLAFFAVPAIALPRRF